ncbi:hypothetical protein WICPIJ_004564 [Wickerhamomyces pijperi]|uniref:Uncharacterized protein n=1 Tax=Wickerhamomyces pijperi TaxID=599730 RepID=A0A9P8TMT0_WICPI|nr:hypothetical protein WICPIJ_004564 [Wickerhamomyces pijperi]
MLVWKTFKKLETSAISSNLSFNSLVFSWVDFGSSSSSSDSSTSVAGVTMLTPIKLLLTERISSLTLRSQSWNNVLTLIWQFDRMDMIGGLNLTKLLLDIDISRALLFIRGSISITPSNKE